MQRIENIKIIYTLTLVSKYINKIYEARKYEVKKINFILKDYTAPCTKIMKYIQNNKLLLYQDHQIITKITCI